jgi:hypothetical protein
MLRKTGAIRIMCPNKEDLVTVGKEVLQKEFAYDCIINKMEFVQINDIYYNLHYEVE